MARPQNADKSKEVRIHVLPRVRAWLDDLAALGLYGKNGTEVAEYFVLKGVRAALKDGGFLRNPPPGPQSQLGLGREEPLTSTIDAKDDGS